MDTPYCTGIVTQTFCVSVTVQAVSAALVSQTTVGVPWQETVGVPTVAVGVSTTGLLTFTHCVPDLLQLLPGQRRVSSCVGARSGSFLYTSFIRNARLPHFLKFARPGVSAAGHPILCPGAGDGVSALAHPRGTWYHDPMISYTVIRSRRRTAALEITRECSLIVRVPMRCSQARIEALVASHEAWILRHLELQKDRRAAAPPPPSAEEIADLKKRAQALLPQRVARFSQQMGLVPAGVRITAARTRFGSCSAKNALCFSCFLMRCPPEAIDLVVVHELAHIRFKNHGPQFYALLGSVLPDYRERRRLLTSPPPPGGE